MCIYCENGMAGSFSAYSAAQFPKFAKTTHATFGHAHALVCLARGFEPCVCRACKRESFKQLLASTRSLAAEFKTTHRDSSAEQITVTLQCKSLFFELFRRGRDLLHAASADGCLEDSAWTRECIRYLARALVNVAQTVQDSDLPVHEVERGLADFADLVGAAMELNGAPPSNDEGDRIAAFLRSAAQQLGATRRKRFGGVGG